MELKRMSESEEQQALFRWAQFVAGRYPELKMMYHIPNEGKRSAACGARLKAEGLRPGGPCKAGVLCGRVLRLAAGKRYDNRISER